MITRYIYVLFIIDPHSGQDAPSFSQDATSIIEEGIFVPLANAPTWPVGYSWFVALWWGLFGIDSRALGIFQTTLLLIVQISVIQTIKSSGQQSLSRIYGYVIFSNFALYASSGQIMYEVPQASFLTLGILSLYRQYSRKKFSIGAGLVTGTFFCFAILMHPSSLIIAVCAITTFYFILPKRKSVAISLIFTSIILSFGPLSQMYRNYVAGDGWGFTNSAFGSASVLAGFGKSSPDKVAECSKIGIYKQGGEKRIVWDSPSRQLCLYKVALNHPEETLKVLEFNTVRYMSPYVGYLKRGGTWYHAFDWRRLFPSYTWWEGPDKKIDITLGTLWIISHFGIFVIGVYQSFKKRRVNQNFFGLGFLFLVPIVVSFVTSLITVGDSRHRMSILMFYQLFISVGLYTLTRKKMNESSYEVH
jgi:hypothetical protein